MRPLYPTAVGVVLLLVLAARPAPARSFTGRLDGLEQHCLLREGGIPAFPTPEESKSLRLLRRVLGVLAKPGRTPAGDLATTAKVATLLEAAFPGDPEFGVDIDGALDGLRADHALVLARLYPYLERMHDGEPLQLRGYAGAERAQGFTAAADATEDRADRARLLGKAVRILDGAWRSALPLSGPSARYLVPASAGTGAGAVDGSALSVDAVSALFYPGTGALRLQLAQLAETEDGPVRTVVLSVNGVFDPGVYPIGVMDIGVGFTYLVPMGGVSEDPGEGAILTFETMASGEFTGTLVVTALDFDRRIVEGTFSFNAKQRGFGSGARSVTGGVFRAGCRFHGHSTH